MTEHPDDVPASEQVMRLQVERVDRAVLVTVAGEVDELTAPRLQATVAQAFDEPGGLVVIVDLTAVSFLGSAGLKALVAASSSAARRDEPLRVVVDETRPVIRPLELTGLDGVLNLYYDVTGALPPHAQDDPRP